MAEPAERITVSREALRAELAEMELRLTRWVASADSVKHLEGRVANLEASRLSREHMARDVLELESAVKTLETESVKEAALSEFKQTQSRKFWGQGVVLSLIILGVNVALFFAGGGHV